MDAPDRLRSLGAFLLAHEDLWRPRPFVGDPRPWRARHPEVAAWTDGLDEAAVEHLSEADLDVDGVPAALRGWARAAAARARVPDFPEGPSGLSPAPNRPPRGVRGRKWAQVHAFGAVALELPRPRRWLEWCSGKGHLVRALVRTTGVPGVGLERDPALCASGTELGDVAFLEADALHPAAGDQLEPGTAAVGLHACGALSDALVRAAAARDVAVLVAPCCPHKRRGPYTAMSEAGRSVGLTLEKGSLLLAVSGEVVGGARIRRLRRRSLVWRAAFSAAIGRVYHPLPSLRDAALGGDFRAFVERSAARDGLTLPTGWAPDAALAEGARRVLRARADGLVRAPFRAALELFTVLDRAAYLQERGRAADVLRFCARATTPRNLLVRAPE